MRAAAAQAASLYLSPTSGEYAVGQSFTVTVGVSSPDLAINAVSGSVSFPAGKLEVSAVSKSGSVLGLWVQEPSFSNAGGTVYFEGIALNPGFIGNSGRVIAIAFKTKAAGAATISISSGSVLANDGKGSNVTGGLGRATVTIDGKETAEQPAASAPAAPPSSTTSADAGTRSKPGAIAISSTSHPDSNAWYSKNTADLRWTLPAETAAVSVFVDQKPDTTPTPVSDGLFDNYSTKRMDDGVWYFHLRAKNAGGWGPASHYRFQIDTSVPDNFLIKFIDGNQTGNPQPTVVFNTTDSGSGIDHYEVKVGEDNAVIVSAVEVKSNPYMLPVQQPGNHRMLVVAVDKAGNHNSASADFAVDALTKPVIVQYPERLRAGDTLTIKGRTDYPDTPVRVWVQEDDGPAAGATVRTDSMGTFSYIVDGKMRTGIYKLWAQVRNENGGLSELSDKVTVVVEDAPILSIAHRDINIWYLVVPLAVLAVGYVVFLFIVRRRAKRYLIKLGRNVAESKEFVHHSFDDLRDRFLEHIKVIEQSRRTKRLTDLERKMLNEFKKDLDELETRLKKHVDVIRTPKNL